MIFQAAYAIQGDVLGCSLSVCAQAKSKWQRIKAHFKNGWVQRRDGARRQKAFQDAVMDELAPTLLTQASDKSLNLSRQLTMEFNDDDSSRMSVKRSDLDVGASMFRPASVVYAARDRALGSLGFGKNFDVELLIMAAAPVKGAPAPDDASVPHCLSASLPLCQTVCFLGPLLCKVSCPRDRDGRAGTGAHGVTIS